MVGKSNYEPRSNLDMAGSVFARWRVEKACIWFCNYIIVMRLFSIHSFHGLLLLGSYAAFFWGGGLNCYHCITLDMGKKKQMVGTLNKMHFVFSTAMVAF